MELVYRWTNLVFRCLLFLQMLETVMAVVATKRVVTMEGVACKQPQGCYATGKLQKEKKKSYSSLHIKPLT